MSVILTLWYVQLFLVVLAIAAAIWTVFELASDHPKALVAPPTIILLLVIWAFFYGQTHVAVKPNEVLLVINKASGEAILPVRDAGITSVPLWTYSGYVFPARTEFQWCPTFTPSSKGGASLKTVFCFTADASQIDWYSQFKAFNGDETKIEEGWQNGIQHLVAAAVSQYVPRDLTDRRAVVEQAVFDATTGWFVDHGIPVKMVGLRNWEFSSAEANAQYDKALLSQTQIDIATAEQQAAQIRANTQIQVATTLAEGQRKACQTAGMTSETNCLEYLRLVWLSSSADPSTLVVVTGSNVSPAIAVAPATIPSTPEVVTTPAP